MSNFSKGNTFEAVCRCNLDAPLWKIWSLSGEELLTEQQQPLSGQYCVGCETHKIALDEVVEGRFIKRNLTFVVDETIIVQCVRRELAQNYDEVQVENSEIIVISVPQSKLQTKYCNNNY